MDAIEAASDVAKSVEGCVNTCSEVCRDHESLDELGGAAGDVSKALNELYRQYLIEAFGGSDAERQRQLLG